jgi:hypothetical protein
VVGGGLQLCASRDCSTHKSSDQCSLWHFTADLTLASAATVTMLIALCFARVIEQALLVTILYAVVHVVVVGSSLSNAEPKSKRLAHLKRFLELGYKRNTGGISRSATGTY